MAWLAWLIAACLIGPWATAPAADAPADPTRAGTANASAARTPAELTAIARLLAGLDPQGSASLQAVARTDVDGPTGLDELARRPRPDTD